MNKTTTPDTTFAAGDRVSVTLPQTGHEPAAATVQAVRSGWFVCLLDEPENHPLAKKGIVSARLSSIEALAANPLLDDTENGETDGGCPECGSTDTERNDGGQPGFICLDCGAAWADADEQGDEIEEALEEAETAAGKMAEALRKARQHYTKACRPSGAATAHNGDTIARELLDYEPKEVAALADRCLGLPKGWHEARYNGLNPGQIRMNSGNKIRGAWKKAEKNGDLEMLARIKFVLGLDSDDEQA